MCRDVGSIARESRPLRRWAAAVIYVEFPPSLALRAIVDRLWYVEGPAESIDAGTIPPDGHTEIIVHAGDRFVEVGVDGATRVQDRLLLAGQTTRAVRVRPTGTARVVGARLRPDGARRLFAIPQGLLANGIHSLSQIDRRLARLIDDDVVGRESPEAMAAALDAALVRALPSSPAASPASGAVALAMRRRGLVRVDDLAAHAGITPRQLERLFRDRVGLSPKMFLRITRFQEVLRAVRDGSPTGSNWASIAAGCGFYDQSHFIRDFKAFVGAPPSQWTIGDASLAAVFSAIRRR
jgi:AraC-like DNA-binding protein